MWHASRPNTTEDELRDAHSFVRDIALAAERKSEGQEGNGRALTKKSGSSIAFEADLWETRLFVRQAVAAMEDLDAGKGRNFLKKAEKSVEKIDGTLLETPESKDLLRIVETEYSVAAWKVAGSERDPENDAGTDSVFAALAHDVLSKTREVLDDPPAFYVPFMPWLQESLIRGLVDLGWTDLATLELDRWMKGAPAFRNTQYQLRQEIAAVHPSKCVLRWAALRSHD
jgi:hypothetical protein